MLVMNGRERLATGSNVSLKNTTVLAVKAAAQSVDETSQAHGNPMIDPDAAHENFRRILSRNLSLNNDLTPKENSIIQDEINYQLLICNGTNDLGIKQGVIYTYKNNSLTSSNLSMGELPKEFGINEDFIINSGAKTVILETPGAIAIVEAKIKPIVTGSNKLTTRWAAAKIIY